MVLSFPRLVTTTDDHVCVVVTALHGSHLRRYAHAHPGFGQRRIAAVHHAFLSLGFVFSCPHKRLSRVAFWRRAEVQSCFVFCCVSGHLIKTKS